MKKREGICSECGTQNSSKVCMQQSISCSSDKTRARGKYFWAIAFVLLIALGGGCSSSPSENTSESAPASSKKQEITEPVKVEKIRSESEFGLGKISLNDSLDKVHKVLGQEKKIESRVDGLTSYVYDDLNVIVLDDAVAGLESNTSRVATIKGVSQGDSLDSVLAAYGQDVIESTYENLQLYEYDQPENDRTNCRIRFAINGDRKVEYISIRRVPRHSIPKADFERYTAGHTEGATDLLFRFHGYITQHRLQDAYSCLSPKLQEQTPYEDWASGFKNTVRSTVSNVSATSEDIDRVILTYELTAVDDPGGTSHFEGTAAAVLGPDGWKLAYIENR